MCEKKLQLNSNTSPIKQLIFLVVIFCVVFPQWSSNIDAPLEVSPVGTVIRSCTDGLGGAYISWSYCCDHPNRYIQRVDRDGYIQWASPIVVGGLGDLQEVHAYVISDASTNVIVGLLDLFEINFWWPFWEYDHKTIVQKISLTGEKLWGENGIRVLDTTMDFSIEGMISDDEGGVIVLLKLSEIPEGYFAADSSTVCVQRIDSDGNKLWGDLGVHLAHLDQFIGVMITQDNFGGAYVRYGLDYNNFVYVRLNQEGLVDWEVLYPGSWWVEKLNPTNSGGLYLSGIDDSLRLNYLTSDGEMEWGENEVVLSDVISSVSQDPKTIIESDDSIVFGWTSQREGYEKCLVQKVSANGDPEWESSLIICDSPSNTVFEDLHPAEDGNYIAVFEDDRVEPGEYQVSNIYAQKIGNDGSLLWGDSGLQVNNDYSNSSGYITDQYAGTIIVFHDRNHGMYANLINRYGQTGVVIDASGDMNRDASIDVLDVVKLVSLILEVGEPASPWDYEMGDLDWDGDLNVLDVVVLVDIILN